MVVRCEQQTALFSPTLYSGRWQSRLNALAVISPSFPPLFFTFRAFFLRCRPCSPSYPFFAGLEDDAGPDATRHPPPV